MDRPEIAGDKSSSGLRICGAQGQRVQKAPLQCDQQEARKIPHCIQSFAQPGSLVWLSTFPRPSRNLESLEDPREPPALFITFDGAQHRKLSATTLTSIATLAVLNRSPIANLFPRDLCAMDDSERRSTKRSRFDQTEPEPRRSRFDRRSRSPPARKPDSGHDRERSPLSRPRDDPADSKSPPVDPAAAAGKPPSRAPASRLVVACVVCC